MLQDEKRMLSNKGEENLNIKQGAEETDEEMRTERTIRNLRVTPATPSEQHAELLHFIAKKEFKVSELREELKRHEEELRLLKKQWETIVLNERMSRDVDAIVSPRSSISSDGSEDEIDKLVNGLGKGIHSVIDGIQKVKESDVTQEKLTQIKNVVSDVANSVPVQQTKRKTADFTSQAWSNISRGFSSLVESGAIKAAKKKTLETVHTVERSINEAMLSTKSTRTSSASSLNPSTITKDSAGSPTNQVFNKSFTKNADVVSATLPTSPTSPISPTFTDFSTTDITVDSPATSTFTLPSPITPITPAFVNLSDTLSASPTAPILSNFDIAKANNNCNNEKFMNDSLVYVIGDDVGDFYENI